MINLKDATSGYGKAKILSVEPFIENGEHKTIKNKATNKINYKFDVVFDTEYSDGDQTHQLEGSAFSEMKQFRFKPQEQVTFEWSHNQYGFSFKKFKLVESPEQPQQKMSTYNSPEVTLPMGRSEAQQMALAFIKNLATTGIESSVIFSVTITFYNWMIKDGIDREAVQRRYYSIKSAIDTMELELTDITLKTRDDILTLASRYHEDVKSVLKPKTDKEI